MDRQDTLQWFLHGRRWAESGDWRRAHELLGECLLREPGNLLFADAFAANLHTAINHPGPSGWLRWARAVWARLRFRSVARSSRPPSGDFPSAQIRPGQAEAIALLGYRPADPEALAFVAESARLQHAPDAARRILQFACQAAADAPALWQALAQVLTDLGDVAQSLVCWRTVCELDPQNEQARESARRLEALLGPREPIGGGRGGSVPASKPASVHVPAISHSSDVLPSPAPPSPGVLASVDPSSAQSTNELDERAWREAARQAADHGEWERAEQLLRLAVQANPGDMAVREWLEDVQLAALRQRAVAAQERAAEHATDDDRALAETLAEHLVHGELDVCRQRAQRYPGDPARQLALARALRKAGQYSEAQRVLEGLTAGERDPEIALQLGELLQLQHAFPAALQRYQTAIDWSRAAPDCGTTLRAALSRAAVLAEALGDVEQAESLWGERLRLVPDDQTARDRLDKLRRIRHKD